MYLNNILSIKCFWKGEIKLYMMAIYYVEKLPQLLHWKYNKLLKRMFYKLVNKTGSMVNVDKYSVRINVIIQVMQDLIKKSVNKGKTEQNDDSSFRRARIWHSLLSWLVITSFLLLSISLCRSLTITTQLNIKHILKLVLFRLAHSNQTYFIAHFLMRLYK